jgi:hypothetical protein
LGKGYIRVNPESQSCAQILSLSENSMTMLLVIPTPTSSGNLTIVIAPLTALPGFTPAQFAVRP